MRKYLYLTFLLSILLLVPLNIVIMGDNRGELIQWAYFTFIASGFGLSFINIITSFEYLLHGVITGKSAVSSILWISGGLLSIFSVLFLIGNINKSRIFLHISALVLITACLFLTSIIIQYGPLFHGPAGVSIPVGLPLMFFLSYWFYSLHRKNMEGCQEE